MSSFDKSEMNKRRNKWFFLIFFSIRSGIIKHLNILIFIDENYIFDKTMENIFTNRMY